VEGTERALEIRADFAERAGSRLSPSAIEGLELEEFSLRKLDSTEGPTWLVTGCPLDPRSALEALGEVFGFKSPEACCSGLWAEQQEIASARAQLEPNHDVPFVRDYLDRLPRLRRLPSA
jgi:hypothetical protein